jgi:hypothetical protein
MWYRVASSEPASYNWGFGSTGRKFAAFMSAYSGIDQSSPLDISGATRGTATPLTAPSVTATSTGDLLLYMGGARNGVTFTADAAMSERVDLWGASGGSNAAITLDEQVLSASGATGTRAASASAAPGGEVGINAAFKPATITPNDCYYFEVYDTTTLVATHGSSGSPVSCNTSTSSYTTDTVSLSELDTVAETDDLRIRMYFKDAASTQTLFDQLRVAFTYSTP